MLNKANISWNANQITKMIKKGTITFDNAVQRGYVWDNKRKSLFIHSLIAGYPVPPFFARKTDKGNYDMLDGKQRINTIYEFMNDGFALSEVPEIENEEGSIDITGKKFTGLDEDMRDNISSYTFTIYYFDNITEDEVEEMFFRLNNGKPITNIELSRVKAKSRDKIVELGEHSMFGEFLTDQAIGKYQNEDIVIKALIVLRNDHPCFDVKVVRPFMQDVDISDEDQRKLNLIFDRIQHVYGKLIAEAEMDDKQSKKVSKRLIKKTNLVSIIPAIWKSIEREIDEDKVKDWVKSFFNGTKEPTNIEEYNTACKAGSGHEAAVSKRLAVVSDNFETFMG